MKCQQDIFGQNTTLASSEAMNNWNSTLLAFLAHGADTPKFLDGTFSAEPGFALGNAVKGLFYLMLGRSELRPTAEAALGAARDSASHTPVTDREMAYIDGLADWLAGRPSGTIQRMERILADHPQDALAMKISHAIRFILGDAKGMLASIEAIRPAYDADHAGYGYLLGCHAFSLEECGEYALAEQTGRRGLEHAENDAWGLHAVAHVYDMTGNSEAGVQWLNGREAAWSHCNNFRYHVWWHKALMHLDLGQIDEVFGLYDQEIRKDKTDDFRDISNATALLSRLELEGIDVGNRWDELADLAETRTDDGSLIFADLHYILALIGGSRQDAITDIMGRMHRDAKRGGSDMDARMANPGLAAAAGLEAFGESDYRTAFLNLANARKSMQLAGGSHAQRDVFERITIDAGIRGGFLDETEEILNERTSLRAGREDRYAAVRMSLINEGRAASQRMQSQVPAE
ncbi:tetratricopeptide repeat protein [Amaricoccus tamworthensis]|uniref:tetratricopeptide repeat protein n=1 Tax=Amaricoccus tamworthensis TaxID=57002 RepID=UPI003C7BA104